MSQCIRTDLYKHFQDTHIAPSKEYINRLLKLTDESYCSIITTFCPNILKPFLLDNQQTKYYIIRYVGNQNITCTWKRLPTYQSIILGLILFCCRNCLKPNGSPSPCLNLILFFLEYLLGRFDTKRHPGVAVSSKWGTESSQSLTHRIQRDLPITMVGVQCGKHFGTCETGGNVLYSR